MAPTYSIEVRFKDGTGHTYTKLTRKKCKELVAGQFGDSLLRPESLRVSTQRGIGGLE